MNKLPAILLVTDNPARRRAWNDALSANGCRVCEDAGQLADDADLAVVVTDREWSREEISPDRCGIVVVGSDLRGDVTLPLDCSPRELQLACSMLTDIVRLRREHLELRELAYTDPLTGLHNRRAWDEELARRGRIEFRGEELCIALFDLDLFKDVNEKYGHLRGDAVLKSVGESLKAASKRRGYYAARLGGDEFGLLLEGFAADEAVDFTERV